MQRIVHRLIVEPMIAVMINREGHCATVLPNMFAWLAVKETNCVDWETELVGHTPISTAILLPSIVV